jgi:hypothetical protein
MPRVTFRAAAEIRTLPGDDGPVPRQVRFFPAGWSGSIPSHQVSRARALGVLADGDEEQGQIPQEAGGNSGPSACENERGIAQERD